MEKETTGQPNIKKIFLQILFVAASLILPGVDWVLFSWMHVLLPTLAFFILIEQGFYKGNRIFIIGSIIGLIGSFVLGSIGLYVFAMSLLPVGYVLAHGAGRQEGPVQSGIKAVAILSLCWGILLSGIITPGEVAPYNGIIAAFDAGIDEAIEYYRVNASSSVEVDMMLETTFLQMKEVVPIIMPSILGGFAFLAVWFTATVGNWMLGKKDAALQPWPHFQNWRLPERLIWPAIICAGATFAPIAAFKFIAINLLILSALVYSLQGFSITVFFMNKWKVPLLFRSFVYVMIVFQSFGTVLLLILGIADTWLNLRKLPPSGGTQN